MPAIATGYCFARAPPRRFFLAVLCNKASCACTDTAASVFFPLASGALKKTKKQPLSKKRKKTFFWTLHHALP